MSLSIEGLIVSYGTNHVLDGIDISVPSGTITAVVGPNGAGKSSLLRAILGTQPSKGHISVDGADAHWKRAGEVHDRTGYLPQDNAVFSALSVLDVVVLGRVGELGWRLSQNKLEIALATLERLDLAHLASLPVGELSGGQRQLVFLAQALVRQPRLLLLDEPTSALDLKHQLIVLKTLRSVAEIDGIAILMVMHDLNLAARFTDQIVVLHQRRVYSAGPPSAVLTHAMFAEVFEVEAELMQSDRGSRLFVPVQALNS
jgi:iron complex transport system ATP-binding protein